MFRPRVATALTACGIETWHHWPIINNNTNTVATALTACGIETVYPWCSLRTSNIVATALTACGIETKVSSPKLVITSNCCNVAYRFLYWNTLFSSYYFFRDCCNGAYRLRYWNAPITLDGSAGIRAELQQYLPLAVLKQESDFKSFFTVCGSESCNSTYRLRYWNPRRLLRSSHNSLVVATALTACGIETVRLHLLQIRSHHRLQRRLLLAVLKYVSEFLLSRHNRL